MDIIEAIEGRRSVRVYQDEQLPKEAVEKLIHLGVKAASGSNMQPWGFVVLQNKAEIDQLSEQTKAMLRAELPHAPYLQQYEKVLKSDNFHIFNNAPTVLCIFGNTASRLSVYDCSLAAGNIMLAGHSMGIGTCWIGFAEQSLNSPAFKAAHKVPETYQLFCVLGMGYTRNPQHRAKRTERKPPLIFDWS